ncbi:twin-arginine translocase TatA/TatE family subunit [Campylobacter upsaliensis]|uniref:Sec-independent protein translocase protein TatA n=1 Tax=Campylobacter upsaliensis TaxID=28080 RepID=A0A448KP94_CAMUP|nr:twin-arginine translocase TatA/TatE family subunit [Campylobacter upsaliensis]EAH5552383.1 twin-arginine translocase TatA/TatE family subunit [Campylobacter upsaliensis]EAI5601466.1 twin-arginine translocase TatA/TatE family subunit [Campylobacter upsaliensis]EAI7263502.1 twin-arginine translocase TatA/TatE family subunit [Campylobacter upsaliensis]EAI9130640.1 twin-arginine translocase TatA/TatE family subunit [Campylobacter upsaliensis]EAJ1461251.1 twin-arginine translocase TatA/TatE fami
MGIGNIGVSGWIIILVIVILLFGAKKIPELAKGVGKGIKTFRSEMDNDDEPKNAMKIEEKSEEKKATSEANLDETKKA